MAVFVIYFFYAIWWAWLLVLVFTFIFAAVLLFLFGVALYRLARLMHRRQIAQGTKCVST